MGRKKKLLTPGKVISGIILVAILIVLYLPTIISLVSSFFQPNIELSLVPSSPPNTDADLRKYGEVATGVSGYRANIYVSLQSADVEIGEAVKFHVEIASLGNSLTKPYFYTLLVNNTGNVVSMFPTEVGLYTYSKPSPWTVNNQNEIVFYSTGEFGLAIPRQTLIEGHGDCSNNGAYVRNCEIWIQRQIADNPSQIGKWELWVFLFDETYVTPEGNTLSSQNAITYTTVFFNVTPKTAPVTSWLWLSGLFSIGFVIVSMFGLFKKLSPWIDAHSTQIFAWWKRNQWIVVFSALLLGLYIIFFLLSA